MQAYVDFITELIMEIVAPAANATARDTELRSRMSTMVPHTAQDVYRDAVDDIFPLGSGALLKHQLAEWRHYGDYPLLQQQMRMVFNRGVGVGMGVSTHTHTHALPYAVRGALLTSASVGMEEVEGALLAALGMEGGFLHSPYLDRAMYRNSVEVTFFYAPLLPLEFLRLAQQDMVVLAMAFVYILVVVAVQQRSMFLALLGTQECGGGGAGVCMVMRLPLYHAHGLTPLRALVWRVAWHVALRGAGVAWLARCGVVVRAWVRVRVPVCVCVCVQARGRCC